MSSHYDALGVTPSATTEEIHDRYRRLAKEHHPDAGGADARMAELNDAWRVLSDPASRRAYDRANGFLGRRPASAPASWEPGPRLLKKLNEHGFDPQHRWRAAVPDTRLPLSLRARQHADFDVLPRLVGRQLWGLHAQDTWIDDRSLRYVAALPGLRVLDISNTHVTDAGLERVAELRQLEELSAWGAHITDHGIPWIVSMTRLVILNLGATRITDAGLAGLWNLKRLQVLNVRETDVTEEGLKGLNRVPALRLLAVPSLGLFEHRRVSDALPGVNLV